MAADVLDLSVVIPTHDRPRFLREAVESVLAQTRAVREILVVDNGTSDAPGQVLAPFGDRVRLIRSQPHQVQIARNTGFATATGRWIATLDDDDRLQPTYFEAALPLLDDPRCDVIAVDHRKFRDEPGGPVWEAKTNFEQAPQGYWDFLRPIDDGTEALFVGKFPLANLLRRIPAYPSSTIFRRDLALGVGGYDPRMRGITAEDIEFLVRLLAAGNLGIVRAPLLDYRVHSSNDSGTFTAQKVGRWQVFEFVRRQHSDLPADFVAALDTDLAKRRVDIFETAFRIGNAALLEQVAPLLRSQDWTAKMRARRLVAKLPRAIAKPLRFGTVKRL
ncbi:glycosyltransferase family 2 protein [Glacieibacterium sp.]|uniref:glycosyltransferase family 2 protein n=1 Tax=Glacieibacterium sp. TaxID=2860237 RepID=UPI003B00CF6A